MGDTTVEAPGRVSLEGVGSLLVSDPLVVNTATPTFTWNATAGATSYTLLVGKIVNGVFIGLWYAPYDAALVGCANGTGICSKASPLPLASGDTIEWAVFASNAAGVGDVSPSLHFVVGPTTPGVPSTGVVTLVGPGVYNTKILAPINTARPTYSWNAIAGATT